MQMEDELWDKVEEQFTIEQRPSRGGGKKKRSRKSKTPINSGTIARENSEALRAAEYRQKIRAFIPNRFFKPKLERLYLPDYKRWVLKSLMLGEPVIIETDLYFDSKRASGPGGQNVNKTSSVPVYTHLPTGKMVESSETPAREQNKGYAVEKLVEILREHIENWKNLAQLESVNLKNSDETTEFISDTLI